MVLNFNVSEFWSLWKVRTEKSDQTSSLKHEKSLYCKNIWNQIEMSQTIPIYTMSTKLPL